MASENFVAGDFGREKPRLVVRFRVLIGVYV